MKKCYTTIQIVVLLFLNSSANGSATTNEDYICNGELCILKGYDPLDSPINGERDTAFGKSKVTWVYFNFIDKNDLVKKVDDQKMMITFQAVAIMIWNDPRLKIKSKIKGIIPLPDLLKKHIWTPKIRVDQTHQRPSSPYKDPAFYRKNTSVYIF